jgi:sulfur-oxidizing protein SoxA
MRGRGAAALALALAGAAVWAQGGPDNPGARSGSDYLLPETRALQDDDFANPGMLWVEEGRSLWDEAPPTGPACAGCHGAPETLRGVGARYPAWDEGQGRVISLEQRIDLCRTGHQGAPPLEAESEALLALTALVRHQSRGLPVAVQVDGPAAQSFANGQRFFETRRGQLDLACADCHEAHAGDHLRGETISQGQTNGFPVYRQLWQTMGSVHRMFAWCNQAVRAEPYPAGSQDYVDLELYLAWRGRGLPVETPAVRR